MRRQMSTADLWMRFREAIEADTMQRIEDAIGEVARG